MEANAKPAVVILAAGKGTRLKSSRPKVLHEIGGKPLLAHVIAAASRIVAPEHIYAVIGHEADQVRGARGSRLRFDSRDDACPRSGEARLPRGSPFAGLARGPTRR